MNKKSGKSKQPSKLLEMFINAFDEPIEDLNLLYNTIGSQLYKRHQYVITKLKIQQMRSLLTENTYKDQLHAEMFVYCCWLRTQYERLCDESDNNPDESLKIDNLNEAANDYLRQMKTIVCEIRKRDQIEQINKRVREDFYYSV